MEVVVEALKASGVAGGLVVLLGLLVKQWFASVREDLRAIDKHLDDLGEKHTAHELRQVTVDAKVDNLERRVEQLEHRSTA